MKCIAGDLCPSGAVPRIPTSAIIITRIGMPSCRAPHTQASNVIPPEDLLPHSPDIMYQDLSPHGYAGMVPQKPLPSRVPHCQ